ncbi:hypothetical protein [Comamonas koreensis]|uniref:Uncharacterized protein n=1 Tax=Comamonas koreensis TaxID=160825 RepID=A0AAW4XVY9_9BURK|nr:hypothetical protein [Comamonas koreensis]MCD2165565.1 hypothetical protein [Comamonas koreensis]
MEVHNPLTRAAAKLRQHGHEAEAVNLEQFAGSLAMPVGQQLVPLVPTVEMFIAGMEADCLGRPSIDDESHVRSIWDAMLSQAKAEQEERQHG